MNEKKDKQFKNVHNILINYFVNLKHAFDWAEPVGTFS